MEQNEARNVLSVTQLNEYIKMVLDGTPLLQKVSVSGEISNLTYHNAGHLYFSVKDDGGVIKAVMFRYSAAKLKFTLENGMKVIITGRVSSYVKSGDYQLYCDSCEPDGVGALYIAYEQLKKKLEGEGLFDERRKNPLPKIPTRIGIITSPTGAAVRDIINITGRRFPYAKLILYPALVQGDKAAESLCGGMNYFIQSRTVDVIIIGRGGGSIEDLWAFNDETLARIVASSPIPVISAVGHETDFTICDFAADRRAPTPSAAAELAVPDSATIKRQLNNVTTKNALVISKKLENYKATLAQLSQRRVLQNPQAFIDDKRFELVSISGQLAMAERLTVSNKQTKFSSVTSKLQALNPMSVITRGYGALFSDDGRVIKSTTQIKENDSFTVTLSDGQILAKAEKITRGEDKNG